VTTTFDKLARPVQKWIRQQGWRELRDIQARAINSIHDNQADLIVAASTAGGKTEAAFFPLISQVLDSPSELGGFDLLYIGPLKALITDQAGRLEDICREAELPVVPWHGDISQSVKSRALKAPRGILLITPESLEALFIRRGLEIPRLFGATHAVVIDELHSVLDSERGVQMRSLLNRLELAVKRPIRRIGLSATLGDMELSRAYLRPFNCGAISRVKSTKPPPPRPTRFPTTCSRTCGGVIIWYSQVRVSRSRYMPTGCANSVIANTFHRNFIHIMRACRVITATLSSAASRIPGSPQPRSARPRWNWASISATLPVSRKSARRSLWLP
jgi:hypothetical protein